MGRRVYDFAEPHLLNRLGLASLVPPCVRRESILLRHNRRVYRDVTTMLKISGTANMHKCSAHKPNRESFVPAIGQIDENAR